METLPKLERVRRLTLTPGTKLVCMSDMHRGDGSGADDFAQNSLIYRCALEHYLENGFTYIELGDAEELWENDNFDQIYITHTSVYELLAKFHDPDPEITDRHAMTRHRHRATAIADPLYDWHIIHKGQSIVIPLIRLHEIDDAPDAACQKISDLLDHQVFTPVTGIITGEKSTGLDPVAPIKRG
jgi:hypothetical protein